MVKGILGVYFILMCHIMIGIYPILFFLLINIACIGQQITPKIKKSSTAQGLSNSVINSIAQDNYGFIWIATQDGLNRFDGYNFTVFKNSNDDSLSLSDNFTSDIYFDAKTNHLWISTNHGLNMYDATRESFTHYFQEGIKAGTLANNVIPCITPSHDGNLWIGTYGSGVDYFDLKSKISTHLSQITNCPELLANARVLSLTEDSFGYLWIGTQDAGLYKYDIRQKKIIYYIPEQVQSIPSNCINTIYEDREQNIWIGSNNGLSWYDRNRDKFVTFQYNIDNPGSLGSNIVKSIFQDHDGILWVGLQSGGISKIRITESLLKQPLSANFEHIYESDDEDGLSYNSVSAIFEDRDRNIWIGTYSGGINMISNTPDLFTNIQHIKNNPNSLSYRKVWGICDDAEGNIWIGTDGGGLNLYQRTTGNIKVYRKQRNMTGTLSDDAILCAFRDHNNNLWFGTYSGGLNFYDKKNDRFYCYRHEPNDSNSLPVDDVRVIYEDRKQNLWIGTNGGGASLFLPSTGKFKKFDYSNSLMQGSSVRCILNDREGNYWFGTYGQGIYKINQDWTQSKNFIDEPGNSQSLGAKTVYAIIEDKKGRIWVGTEGGGLGLFHPENETFENFTEQNGLANHIVRGIVEDANGYLWVTTNNGLSRFDPERKKFISFDEKDGLASGEFSDGSVLFSNGLLYFGNMNGLSWIDPKIDFETKQPNVYISELQLFNYKVKTRSKKNNASPLEKSIIESDRLVLSHKQSVLTLGFVAFNYRSPDKMQYAYMLEGLESQWNFSGNQHTATYRSLPSGHYVFKVKASNLSGSWGDSYTSLDIFVKPPFWRTWWALAFYYLMAFLFTYLIIRYNQKQNSLRQTLLLEKMTRQHEQQLNQEKLNFFTNITHEFRSPLTLIQGPIEDLLRERDVAYRIKKKLLLIYRNSNRLNDLINKLLDFRKVETGSMELKVSNGNIIQTIKEICFPFREIFLEKKITFTLEHETDEINMWYDADKVQIILNNLLTNAYKYTNELGKISVNVSKGNTDDENPKIVIKVCDTGIGIPDEYLPNIFDRYYRTGQQDKATGSGIGLALTKSLVELHKGKIRAESQPGKGTDFIVELPLGKDLFASHQISETKQSSIKIPKESFNIIPQPGETDAIKLGTGDSAQQKILLIIEDNIDIRGYIKDSFTDEYKVLDAPNGEEGLELAFKLIPDIIITDIMMPGIDGHEVCKRIKNNIKTCHIPVVMLTARDSLYHKQEGYETGADSYVTKPFSTVLLKSRVQNLMRSRKMLTEHISRTILLQPDELHINLKDEKFISDVMSIIEKHITNENFSVDFLSSELGISHPVLYRKIKALSGFSIAEFVRSVRLKNAAQLLRTKQFTVSEVAYKVGFNDMKYFRQCFREQYKVLPSDYQKQEFGESTDT